MDRQACNTQHFKHTHTDLCNGMLKDKLSADVLILLNKISPFTYLISSLFQLQGPLYPVLYVSARTAILPFFLHPYFLSLSPRFPKGPELRLHSNYIEAAGTYLNIY